MSDGLTTLPPDLRDQLQNPETTHETVKATHQGLFGEEYEITLVRQSDGRYEEIIETPQGIIP